MNRLAIMAFLILAMVILIPEVHAGETYLKFEINSKSEIEKLTKIVSIDNIDGWTVYAYANDNELEVFRELGYKFTILPHPSSLYEPVMADTKDDAKEWDTYPTYTAYVDMMYQFAADYPALCQIYDIGNTIQGRDLLFAKISDNVSVEEDEPEVMYTSSMHGDEVTGYVLTLHLIDSLLTGYGSDSLITRLVDSCEIWINPLANPDGTYAGGNHTVGGATRYNAGGVDLNRNFPDPEDGNHPDGHSWQPETVAMMDYATAHSLVISANFHGGAEVINYPWDTWPTLHADDQWYQDISHIFADSAQYYSPSGYMNGFNDGITNGYAWYTISGGRQDYMNYWHGCREVTAEISDIKLLPAGQLPAFWTYLRVSFLDWFENALYGIRGIVTDNSTGLPIRARIEINGHDFDSSHVYTDPDVGDYHRMIDAGTYDLEFTAPGYLPHTEYSVAVGDWDCVRLDVALEPLPDEPVFRFVEYNAGPGFPGDTVSMNITIENIGGGNAYNTSGELLTEDTYVTVTQPNSSYPTIQALGGSGTSLTEYEFIISPACTLFHVIDFQLALTADGGHYDTLDFTYMVGDRVVFFFDDFSFDLGWTGLGGAGEWTVGPATGGSGSDGSGGPDPSQDYSAGDDNYLLGNDLTSGTGGDYNSGLSSTYWVTSPYFDCTDFTGVELKYYRWLGVESSSYDHAYLQVFNGSSWVTIFENASAIDESSWSEQFYDVSAYADGNPDFQIRFGIGLTDGSVQYCGWNIDDVELKGYGTVTGGFPDISYTPDDFYDSLHMDQSVLDTIRIYNNGEVLLRVRFTAPDEWIIINEEQHNIIAGDSLLLPVTFNTVGLTPGDYIGSIGFTSNDPDTPNGVITVNLHIYAPDIAVSETSIEEFIYAGYQSTHPFIIENNGQGILNYQISRMMFNGKMTFDKNDRLTEKEPIGYHAADIEKGGEIEPYFSGGEKSNGGPDDWGHIWIDSDDPEGPTYEWIDISAAGTEITGLGDDDSTAAISIGFDFPFYENLYSQLHVGSNGILTFGGGSTARSNKEIPNTLAPNNMIAMWWDDLDPRQGGHIYYYFDEPGERFIVSFLDIKNYYSSIGTGSLTFQAVLYADGRILLQYGVMDPGSDADGLAGASIGIENSAGDDGLEVVYNAAYMHNNLAVQIDAPNWLSVVPGSGEIDPFTSDTIEIGFDATELEPDAYTGQIIISSNDPDTPELTVPVTLNVEQESSAPAAPAQIYPANQAQDVPQPITFVWNTVPGTVPPVDSFQIRIDDDSLFTELVADTVTTDTTCDISGLAEGVTFYWKIRAHNDVSWGQWSGTRSFITVITWTCGDVDSNDAINLLDITFLIGFMYKGGQAPEHLEAADVNADGAINILDITYLIAYLYKGGPDPNCSN